MTWPPMTYTVKIRYMESYCLRGRTEDCSRAQRNTVMTEKERAKRKCFLQPLPFASPGRSSLPGTLCAAGADHLTDIISGPHNVPLGRYCYCLHCTDKVIEAQKGLEAVGARWPRE